MTASPRDPQTRPDRLALATLLTAQQDEVAQQVTAEFLERHPEWQRHFGDEAWTRGVEDVRSHISFLAGAIQSGDTDAFREYARWSAGVLQSRAMSSTLLIQSLEEVRDHIARMVDPPAAALIRDVVNTGCAAIRDADTGTPASATAAGTGDRASSASRPERAATSPVEAVNDDDRSLYLQAVLAGERRTALVAALEPLQRGASVADIYCDLLQPTQYAIGRLWERNQISVAREHMATAITQYVVSQLYGRLSIPAAVRGNAIVTGVEGELHQLGANMVADVLEAAGWNVRFLGTQLPHRDVLGAIEEHEPRVVGISATMLFSLPRVGQLVEEMRTRFPADMRIVVGGGAFRGRPRIWRDVGADGFAEDLRDGATLVNRLTS
ncbi:MAG TPA: cobalamin-dependent protein [Longimicrobiales bacterium]|nr:cobalamin-dependent protein [Longimicrobiales bacterium]